MFHRPTARELALREPARTALMGGFDGADFGEDFGGFGGFGIEGNLTDANQSTGLAARDWRQGHTHNAALLTKDANALRRDNEQILHWQRQERQMASREAREQSRLDMLDPNEGLATKVARYSFSLNQPLVIGTPAGINATLQPDTKIRPQRVIMNVTTPGMILVTTIKVANVSVLVGASEDAYTYGATAVGVHLDMPTLDPSNRATVQGAYGGLVPTPFAVGYVFTFVATFQGPATVTAGG